MILCFVFFNDTATTEIYTLSLHDALPIFTHRQRLPRRRRQHPPDPAVRRARPRPGEARLERQPRDPGGVHPPGGRSEEHTSELQSRQYLVCRLLLEKKTTCLSYGIVKLIY